MEHRFINGRRLHEYNLVGESQQPGWYPRTCHVNGRDPSPANDPSLVLVQLPAACPESPSRPCRSVVGLELG